VLHGGPDPQQRGKGGVGGIVPIVDPLHITRLAEARNLKFCGLKESWGLQPNLCKSRSYVGRVGSRDPLL